MVRASPMHPGSSLGVRLTSLGELICQWRQLRVASAASVMIEVSRLCWLLAMTTFKLPFQSGKQTPDSLSYTWQGRPVKLDAAPVRVILRCLFQASLPHSLGQLTSSH